MDIKITASMLYDYIRCPHRVRMDLYGDRSKRDEISAFLQLLWEDGQRFEKEVMVGTEVPFTDLSKLKDEERETATIKAMERGDELIYSGRIQAENLLGIPDLLRKKGNGYVAGDIKSGSAFENDKPKKHYAVQLSLYTDILEKMGCLADRNPFVWDGNGEDVEFDLEGNLWEVYEDALQTVESIIKKEIKTAPALFGECKQCHWRTVCRKVVEKSNDLSLIPELGRTRRDTLNNHFPSVKDLAKATHQDLVQAKKKGTPGMGINLLAQFHQRAKLLTDPNATPIKIQPINFPYEKTELFFDVETDPMRDLCYLHGFVVREGKDNSTEQYIAFYADDPTPEEEEKAFAEAIQFIKKSEPWAMYYYSHYERTTFLKLQAIYPDVVTREKVEAIFDRDQAVDLYTDIVKKKTEWPTNDKSLKTLAKYLGFKWRDTDPSGAASIEWYHRWVDTKDPEIKQRILEYNEDDCRATRVLLDGIIKLMS